MFQPEIPGEDGSNLDVNSHMFHSWVETQLKHQVDFTVGPELNLYFSHGIQVKGGL